MIGPSLVLLGLGLGSGEILLWPYLSSQFGLGIIWAAVIGITMQYFINMEISRYTIIKGESVFVGFSKMNRSLPYWFIFSTFIAWFWPGIIATSAKVFSIGIGFWRFDYLAICALVAIGIVLTLGKSVYKTVEKLQKIIICIGIPSIIIITLSIITPQDINILLKGLIGIGDGYRFIPLGHEGFSLFVFLGALAYAGAGGNLNLAQSFYVKEKGYGMCKGKIGISNAILNKKRIDIEGKEFDLNKENISIFRRWWHNISLEHFWIFLVTGAVTIILLAILASSTSQFFTGDVQGLDFLINESKIIAGILNPITAKVFIAIISIMLFATQLTVLDSTSRIIAENVVLINRNINIARAYYLIVWLQIIVGIIVFIAGFNDPILLVITGAVLNAISMFVHIGLTRMLNKTYLHKSLQPSFLRRAILNLSWLVFGVLSVWAIVDALTKYFID
jgi:hypothetical protein